jgi:hypothetical protein
MPGPTSVASDPSLASKESITPPTQSYAKTSSGSLEPPSPDDGGEVDDRRQKRLERNRESARLSRRRRKQYLEVLEERVTNLSIEMDKGRREHAMKAVETLKQKRRQTLTGKTNMSTLALLTGCLSRSSNELRVAFTFFTQQLISLSLPLQDKFVLWLTLQNDTYYRGGRAASERLSAARIGERVRSLFPQ